MSGKTQKPKEAKDELAKKIISQNEKLKQMKKELYNSE
jgi:hypothetical protein